jgi:SGNH hydrolase-like domain, acetyltransferase AlgX
MNAKKICVFSYIILSSSAIAASIDSYPDYFLGKNGWVVSKLDYTEIVRFRDVKSSWPQLHFDTMDKIVKGLESKGIKVVIAVVPQRLNVYPQMLPDDLYSDFIKEKTSYENILPEITSRGMKTVDFLTAIKSSKYYSSEAATYYRFEAHWNFYGANAAATAVAKAVKTNFGNLKLRKANYTILASPPVSKKETFWLNNLPKDVQSKVHPDYEIPYTLKNTEAQADLLGDNIPDVTIVGTSFTGYGFRQSLMATLKTDILDASMSGKGMWTPMVEYLKSGSFKKRPPKLLIWETPEIILANYPMPTKEEMAVLSNYIK